MVSRTIVLKTRNSYYKNAPSRNLWAELLLAEANIAGFVEFSGAESDSITKSSPKQFLQLFLSYFAKASCTATVESKVS